MIENLQPRITAFAVALLFAVLAIVVLVTAYGYSRSSGVFPIFVGWIFLALALLEVGVQLKSMLRGDTNVPIVAGDAVTAAGTGGMLREFGGFLWLASLLVVLYVAGFLIATPVFMFAFLLFAAHRSIMQSTSVALIATVFVYVVFVLLLQYRLYPGILFGG